MAGSSCCGWGINPRQRLLAIQSQNVLECVVTAFNPQLAVYSPGLLLFHQLTRKAPEHGIERIHLTRGTEHFKERFENDCVTVADAIVGQSLLARQVLRARLTAATARLADAAGATGTPVVATNGPGGRADHRARANLGRCADERSER